MGVMNGSGRRVQPAMRRGAVDHVRLAGPGSSLPVQGASSGWLIRRDQALAALTAAGLTLPVVAGLTVGSVQLGDGQVLVRPPGQAESTSVNSCADGRSVCGACAVHRWVHALELVVLHTDPWVIPAILARAPALAPSTQHICLPARSLHPAVFGMPLMPPVDQWGPVPARAGVSRADAFVRARQVLPTERRVRPGQTFPGP